MWEQHENPQSVAMKQEDHDSVSVHQHYLDFTLEKGDVERDIQSCSRVVECPPDTARVAATSGRARQYLTPLLQQADLVIWNVSKDQL